MACLTQVLQPRMLKTMIQNASAAVTDNSKAATSPTKQLPETGSKVDQLPEGSKP